MKKNTNSGFTLIELLVVIAIIGILTGIVLVSMSGARANARDARRQTDMYHVFSAMELCYNAPSCGNQAYLISATMPTAIGTFLPAVPTDPSTNASYGWVSNSGSGNTYCSYAKLEQASPTPGQSLYMVASPAGTKQKSMAAAPAALTDCN